MVHCDEEVVALLLRDRPVRGGRPGGRGRRRSARGAIAAQPTRERGRSAGLVWWWSTQGSLSVLGGVFVLGVGHSRRRGSGVALARLWHAEIGSPRRRRVWRGTVRTFLPLGLQQTADRRMEFNGQIRSEWTNVAHLKKRFEAPYEAARATRPPNTPNPTKNRPQDTHNTLTEQENSARASSADQLSIRWAIRPKRQNRRLRTLRSPNSRPERAPARAWCGRRRACRPGRWGRS